MRIALVCRDEPPVRWSDAGQCFLTLARALSAQGHDVHLITENTGAKRPTLSVEGRLRIRRLSVPGEGVGAPRRAMDFAVEAARVLARMARRGEIDAVELVDIDGTAAPWLLGRAALPDAAVPTVVSLQSHALDARSAGAVAAFADAVVAPTEARARAAGVHTVLPNPVECGSPLRGAQGGPPFRGASSHLTRTILAIVRPDVPGDTDLLAKAWSKAAPWFRGCTLAVLAAPGASSIGASTLRLTVERSLSDDARPSLASVAVASDARAIRAAAADAIACVVASSVSAFCCASAVAMAAGCAVLADHEEATFPFRRGDADALAARLAEVALMSDAALAAAGRDDAEHIRMRHDPAAAARARVDLYARLAGVRPLAAAATKQRLAAWRTLRGLAEATA
jgi:hypothetical protein